ncbi:polyribonucleotide nucleotidyltransferase [Candidatus Woesebacteria bacterium]|nr:MAG: polyribonucleotide nucleotidyltransferase [Candidatus Woesebacteria bacterium]
MKKIEKSIELGGRKLTITGGHVAGQATSAVMASYGETVVLVTIVASELKEDIGYFPLHVEYRERLYAGGRIKGSRWVKREGRPSDDEILTARLIDRSIRPLFPKEYKKEVQIIITVLSLDGENSPDVASAVATSVALTASTIPWQGPVGTVKVGMKDNKFIINPVDSENQEPEMELIVSGTDESVVMIEAVAQEAQEDKILEGISLAQKEIKKIIKFVNDFAKEVDSKKEKLEKEKTDSSLEKKVKQLTKDMMQDLIKKMATGKAGRADYQEAKSALIDSLGENGMKAIKIFEELVKSEIRKKILSGKRPDGRKPDEIRKLSAQVGILPRTHGSAIFQRGQTQALAVATLGPSSLEQLTESALGEETKRYIHHYSMPPFSIGETGRVGWPARREVGHGALAEKALLPVIPSEEKFPYTIHVVSETLSSNGSSSMAAVCGSTLSLMDAGVPIEAPVAGIAMGLIIESEKKFVVLSDITGLEDENGDMDFKVAGTEKGVTALQMDVKTLRLTNPILKEALEQAKKGRAEILKVILSTIDKPHSKVSAHAPKIKVIKIDQEKIGEIIGPGGRIIKKMIADTGAQIDVEDDGAVSISGSTEEEVAAAVERIEALTKEVKPGEIYEGEVKRIQSFGVFVEILPGKEGMVHVSDMSQDFVKDPSELVSVGDKTKVRVKEIDNLGRINLSMLLDGDKERDKRDRRPDRGERRPDRGNRRSFDRRSRGRSASPTGRSSGPHFPASRLLEKDKKSFS